MGCVSSKNVGAADTLDEVLPPQKKTSGLKTLDAKQTAGAGEADGAVQQAGLQAEKQSPAQGAPKTEGAEQQAPSKPQKAAAVQPDPQDEEDELPETEEVTGAVDDQHVQVVDVPGGGYRIRFASLSKRGYYPEAPNKANQDSFFVGPQYGGDPNDHMFGVYDGHGENGTPCSQFSRDKVGENLLRHRLFKSDVPQAFHGAFVSANAQLHRAPIDDTMSGSTGIAVLLRNRTLYAANVGDSRAVIAERRGKKLVAVDLSNDQTPFRDDECTRVRACGARVLTLDQLEGLKNPNVQCWGGEDDDDGDPPRLWVPNGMYPGTAFTRSIGDTVAERIGVTAVPEVLVMPLTESHPFFVVASDGVFEFLSSQAVVDMVNKFDNPYEACKSIVAESYRLWLEYETRTDDITIIVVQIEGLSGPAPPPTKSALQAGNAGPAPGKSRRKAIEWQEPEASWSPRQDATPKSPHDQAKLEAALRNNLLFQSLTDKQRQMLINSMQRLHVKAGDIVIRQGETGDKFYCCEEGEFEVLVSSDQSLGQVVHCYNSNSRPCFGDLALLYGTRREASVRAATNGSLWTLERSAFRAVQRMGTSSVPHLRLLRSVPLLAPLSITQLSLLATKFEEVTLREGEGLNAEEEELDKLYIVESGEVQLRMSAARLSNGFEGTPWEEMEPPRRIEQRGAGQCVGEWLLTGGRPKQMSVAAKGTVKLLAISQEQFEATVGPLPALAAVDKRLRIARDELQEEREMDPLGRQLANTQMGLLEWEETVMENECFQVARVRHKKMGSGCSMKRWSKAQVQRLGRSQQALRERTLLQSLPASPFVPELLCTLASNTHVGLLFNARVAAPLSLLMLEPLSEVAARHVAASAVLALQLLHQAGVISRAVAPDSLYLDDKGHLQLADLRFAKRLSDGRTYTMCGTPDYLAPEVIAGTGHGQPADWWALGVLLYHMLLGEGPFGTWRDSELQIYTRIALRQMQFPRKLGQTAADLIDKLMAPKPEDRLGGAWGGAEAVKQHPWFAGVNWHELQSKSSAVPPELLQRLAAARKRLPAGDRPTPATDSRAEANGGTDPSLPQWFDDW